MAITVFSGSAGNDPQGSAETAQALRIEMESLAAQAKLALARLQGQPDFFKAIVHNIDDKVLAAVPREARAEPEPFVAWLAQAALNPAREVMWAVRDTLEDHAAFRTDGDVQKAAIAVYMLCALRWVDCKALPDGSRVVAVPTLGCNVLAVLSAALFGGRIEFALQNGTPQPVHLYDVRAPAGESPSTNLLRAIYDALFPERRDALENARRDDDDPQLIDELVERLTSRLSRIRRRELNITLVIDSAEAFQHASWSHRLDLTPFAVDARVAETVFLIEQPHRLDQDIRDFLYLLRPAGTEPISISPPPPSPNPTMSQPNSIQVNLHGNNANLSFGNQSPIASHITQTQAQVSLNEFQAAIQALKDEIARLQSVKARDKMAGDLAVIEAAVADKSPEGKSRIARALEALKNAGEAADGAESVLAKLVKLQDLAAPILAALF